MRRLSRRLCEHSRLKSMASSLVGIGLATGLGAAQGGPLLDPGTTSYLAQLSSETPLEIGSAHTLLLETGGDFFGLEAPLINRGVVHLLNTWPQDHKAIAVSSGPQVNRGRWIVDQHIAYYAEGGLDNQGGVLQIGANSTVYSTTHAISGGRIHGMANTSSLSATDLTGVTISGHLNLVPWQPLQSNLTPGTARGVLTVEGTLGIKAVNLSDSTSLRGAGRTVLNNGTVGAAFGVIAPQLTVEAGHTLSGTGSISNVQLINQGAIETQRGEQLSSNKAIVQQGANAQLVVNGFLMAPSIHVQGGSIDMGYTGLVSGDVLLSQGRLVLHNFIGVDEENSKVGAAIAGDLTLSEQSQFEVIAGPGHSIAVLEVWGRASLDGELIVSFMDGAKVPSTFELAISGNDVQGSFRSLRVNGAGNLPWTLTELSRGQYTITAVPEPGSLGLMLCGLGVVGWRVRRRAPAQVAH